MHFTQGTLAAARQKGKARALAHVLAVCFLYKQPYGVEPLFRDAACHGVDMV